MLLFYFLYHGEGRGDETGPWALGFATERTRTSTTLTLTKKKTEDSGDNCCVLI